MGASATGRGTVQTSRVLHYAVWFLAGVAMGAYGIERTLFASNGALARQWLRWGGLMYLVHFAFVSWFQLALLTVILPGVAKGAIVFLAAVASSWAAVATLRRNPAVARIL